MTNELLVVTLLMPWAVVPLSAARVGRRMLPWALAVPPALAVLVALADVDAAIAVPGLLLDGLFGVDDQNRVFVGVTGAAWLAAALTLGRLAGSRRFAVFFALAMAGNLCAVLSRDAVTYYCAFAVMSLSAYGLIAHDDTGSARFAGRVYMTLTIVAELLLFAALIVLAASAVSTELPIQFAAPPPDWAVLAVVAGFGIKAGLVPLHVTLPLAYAAAPGAAGIALAGGMLNAGLLGWLSWLPLGQLAAPGLGGALTALGVAGVVVGVVAGVCQRDARALLGYSSISQVALVVLALGAALQAPGAWAAMLPVVLLFVLHHGLIKTAAFCLSHAAGASRRWRAGLALVPAAALAGTPFTLGLEAKSGLKQALAGAGQDAVASGLVIASLGTSLLMARWWVLLAAGRRAPSAATPNALIAAVLLLLAYAVLTWRNTAAWPAGAGAALWPPLAAVALSAVLVRLGTALRRALSRALPPGDIAVPAAALVAAGSTRLARANALIGAGWTAVVDRLRGLAVAGGRLAQSRQPAASERDPLPAYLAVAVTLVLLLVFHALGSG